MRRARHAAVAVGAVAGAVLGARAASTYRAYRRELAAAWTRVRSGSRLVRTARGLVEYAIAGRGPCVLAVHGAGGGFDQGLDIAGELASHGFGVVAVSRFGYLRTPLPADASAEAQADAHAALLDALGIERAAVVGASAGAPSSLQFALRHPGRCSALVLIVPASYVPRPGNAPSVHAMAATRLLFGTALRSDFLMWAAIHGARDACIAGLLATPLRVVREADPAERNRVAMMLAHVLPVSARRRGLVNDAAITSSLSPCALERIGTPTLVLGARDDRFGTWDAARYTAEHVAGARFVGFESGGHVLVGRQAAAMGEIAAFLRTAAAAQVPAHVAGAAGPANAPPH